MVNNNANTFLPPNYVIPGNLLITAITNSYPAQVTFVDTFENTYVVNQCVYMIIPKPYGMVQMNGINAKILSIIDNVFFIDVDSTYFDLFAVPAGNVTKPASMSPGGSRNLTFNNNTTKVPFQAYNNIGN